MNCQSEIQELNNNACSPAYNTTRWVLGGNACPSTNNTTTLLPAGAIWKYSDVGDVNAANWNTLNYNDNTWLAGAAELGYGDQDEVTPVRYGSDGNNKFITTYFRKNITITNPNSISALSAKIKMDDGAVVYCNGTEVYRQNLPTTGTISYATLASGVPDESFWYTFPIPTNLLQEGNNILAVEIHQASAASSDISFNLELNATQTAASTISASICNGQSYPFNNQNYTQAGTYTKTVPTAYGCDSTITLNLQMGYTPDPPTIFLDASGLIAANGGITVDLQWYVDGIIITGATAQTYVPTTTGNYTVIAQYGDCYSGVSEIYTYNTTGLKESIFQNVYLTPNPTNGIFSIQNLLTEKTIVKIYNSQGQLMQQSQGVSNFNISNYSKGMYTIHLQQDKSYATYKLIVQ